MTSRPLKFAIIGTGFWANYQLPAWLELPGVELVALLDRVPAKAEKFAHQYKVPHVYDTLEKLLQQEKPDFVDIITDADTHAPLAEQAARAGVHVICQKPMAPQLASSRAMAESCKKYGVDLYVHENWRWQMPIRTVKNIVDAGTIGRVFKARVSFCSAFPVFENQPFLAELDQFIISDIGSHILDVCRFLFGEVESLLCHTATVNAAIRGEDVANVMMKMKNGVSCYAEMSYASILPEETFPQTFITIEGELGSIILEHDYVIRTTTKAGTIVTKAEPKQYSWANPDYALIHSSIVDCNRNILGALRRESAAETTAADNLETVRLVHAAYASAAKHALINIPGFHG